MKKFRFKTAMLRTALLTCAFASSVMGAKAQSSNFDFEANGVKYLINAGTQTVTIAQQGGTADTPYTGLSGAVVIDSIVNGYRVTKVAPKAFINCTGITSIKLPASVSEFVKGTVTGSEINKVLPDGSTADIPNSASYNLSAAFAGCTSLTTANLSEGNFVETGGALYVGCTALTNVSMPNSLVSLTGYDFIGCSSLRTINWENTALENIGVYSFYQLNAGDGLRYVYLPESVKTIGESAFYKNDLRKITDLGNSNYPTQSQADSCSYLTTNSNISSVSHLKNVTSIGDYAFSGNWSFTSICLPKVNVVPNNCLASCFNVKWVILGDSLRTIGDMAFNGLAYLHTIAYPSLGYTVVNNESLIGGNGLHFPSTLDLIGKRAFFACTGFTDVYCLSNPAPKLYCHREATLFGQVLRESTYSFSTGLTATLHYPAGADGYNEQGNTGSSRAQYCWAYFFSNRVAEGTSSNNAPRRVEASVGSSLKYSFDSDHYIDFHKGLLYKFDTQNKTATLLNTGQLLLDELSSSDPLYGANEFYWENVGETYSKMDVLLTLGGPWKRSGNDFYIDGDLTIDGEINVDGEGTYQVSKIYAGAFYYATYKMESITLPAGMTDVEGKIKTTLMTDEASYLFCLRTTLQKVVLSKELLENLSGGDFAYCSNLETVTTSDFPESTGVNLTSTITKIPKLAFFQCAKISTINLPEKLEVIGNKAFYGTNIQKLVIPQNVNYIEREAFSNNSNLTKVEFLCSGVPTLENGIFYKINTSSTLYAQNGKKDDYSTISDNFAAVAVRDVRNLTSGNFGTVCLGYDCAITDELKAKVDIYEVVGKTEDGGELKTITIDVIPETETVLTAGKPYFFRAKADVTGFAFEKTENSVILNNAQESHANGLYGALDPTTVDEGVYMLKNNTLYKAADGSKCAANRAYLDASLIVNKNQPLSAKAKRFQFDDDATGILFLESDNLQQPVSAAVYDLSGRRVNPAAAHKGIYIQNGKKVVR